MKKNKLVWRLGKLPSVAELQELVKDKIITNEEAREILFNEQTEEDVDKDSLKSEIKFLRELVEKLSNGNTTKLVEYIYSKPYDYDWYKPYVSWCTTSTPNLVGSLTPLSRLVDVKTF